jgi:hypothetical protein
MFAKLGFVLLFVIFGGLTFLMGVFATDDSRGQLPGLEQMLQTGKAPGTAPGAALPAASKAPEATSAGKPASAKPRPMEDLLIPANAQGKVRYTVQLGMFPDQAAAVALAAQVEDLHMPGIKTSTQSVRDRAGQTWWIATAGDQDAPEALESARLWLSETLALASARVIQLPPAAP